MTTLPAFEPFQARADGVQGRPAVKTVGGVGREQEATVSGQCPAQEAPEGRVGFQSGQLVGEVT